MQRMRFGTPGHVTRFLIIACLILTVVGLVLFLGAYHAVPSALFLLCLTGFTLAVLLAPQALPGQAVPAPVRSRSPPRS